MRAGKSSFLKDLHPDHSLIGRGSCYWTKEGNLFLFADKVGSLDRTRTGSHEIESLAARLLSVRGPLKMAPRLGFAPRPFRLTGGWTTVIPSRNIGHPGNAPGDLLVPSQAGSLSPSCPLKWRRAEGFHPKPLLRGSTCFQDKVPVPVLHSP